MSKRSSSNLTTSSKSAKQSNISSPSSSCTPPNGKIFFNSHRRSVLHTRLGLPLLCQFHNVDLSVQVPGLPHIECEAEADAKLERDVANVFKTSILEFKDNERERDLTMTIRNNLNKIFKDKKDFEVNAEDPLKFAGDTPHRTAHMDIVMLGTKAMDNQNYTPCLVVEVGLEGKEGPKVWWKKLDQGFRYLLHLRGKVQTDNTELHCRFEEPLFLAIVTLDRKTKQCQMGLFLCSPKSNNLTVSLFWQQQCHDNGLVEASKAFGKMIMIAAKLEKCRQSKSQGRDYKYFSTNCCKYGEKVCKMIV
jgi:hypothetical protein